MMTSRDHGANWTVGTPAYSGGSECQAVQLGDGSIMLNMRNDTSDFEPCSSRAISARPGSRTTPTATR